MPTDSPLCGILQDLLERIDLDGMSRTRLVEEVAQYTSHKAPGRPVVALLAVDIDR